MASGHLIEVGHLIVNTEHYKHVGKNFDGLTVIYDPQTTPTILVKNSWDTSSGSRKPLPPQQCWKILHFCELKDQKITDFQHCKWGEGEIVYSGPRLLSRIVCKKNLKNVTPTGIKDFEM